MEDVFNTGDIFSLVEDGAGRVWAGLVDGVARFEDGRPKVPDDILQRMKQVTTTQAWGTLRGGGYEHQYEGNWQHTHPGKRSVHV